MHSMVTKFFETTASFGAPPFCRRTLVRMAPPLRSLKFLNSAFAVIPNTHKNDSHERNYSSITGAW
eukprot:scaffold13244_cov126-Skeletonema_dohrnii-CCMP3373.AAC.1